MLRVAVHNMGIKYFHENIEDYGCKKIFNTNKSKVYKMPLISWLIHFHLGSDFLSSYDQFFKVSPTATPIGTFRYQMQSSHKAWDEKQWFSNEI